MLSVELHNIFSDEEAAGKIGELLEKVTSTKDIIVITKNGHPAVALVEVEKLEGMAGMKLDSPAPAGEPAPAATPAPTPMIDASSTPEGATFNSPPPMPSPLPDMPMSTPPSSAMASSVPPMPAMPAMPAMGTMPTETPTSLPVDDSPMNEPAPMDTPAMPAASPTPNAVEPTPAPAATAPIMPLPVQTRFGEDLPDSGDPSNGSPLA